MQGKTATAATTVTTANTAKSVGSGSLEVFSTPMMIALMEQAACNALADYLEPTQTSVGTQIAVEHTAASPLNATITATATVTAVDGRKISFDLTAADQQNPIGKGNKLLQNI
ncbi:MAG: thioesterase [Defluviitaleaceae bacterium]|nr:thioesterase [Defluviitaleaceae bacterium]